MTATRYFAERALLPDGWARDVRFEVGDDGALTAVVDMGPYESPAGGCSWDCVGNDGLIGIDEFLKILAHWGDC